jgi:hypothetical protein
METIDFFVTNLNIYANSVVYTVNYNPNITTTNIRHKIFVGNNEISAIDTGYSVPNLIGFYATSISIRGNSIIYKTTNNPF